MREIRNFQQADEALSRYISKVPKNGKYTLDRMKHLMNHLGNPQDNLRVVHVAGTSGKTSTCYYVASLLKQAGKKVGLTVSPHVDCVCERAQIDLEVLDEREYCRELSLFLSQVDSSNINPSYFEVLVAFAYWLFDKKKVDFAVVEVGLGGLLDGTNVVDRSDKICVITDIGLDHTEILGKTIKEIAFQKAGIIQHGNRVFMKRQSDEIVKVITDVCNRNQALLKIIDENEYNLGYLPLFQQRNFSLALTVARSLMRKKLTDGQIREAASINIPAREEVVIYKGKTVIMDGSHNEQKIAALVDSTKKLFPGKKMNLLVSFGDNKQDSVLNSLKLLRQLGGAVIITEFGKAQDEFRSSLNGDYVAKMARTAGFTEVSFIPDPRLALKDLLQRPGIGLITGSFYLLNDIRPKLIQNRN